MAGISIRFVLLPIVLYSSALAAAPSWLADLDRTDPHSLCQAQERLRSRFSVGSDALNAAVFDLWDFYNDGLLATQDRVQRLGEGLQGDQFEQLASALRLKGTARSAALSRVPVARDRIQRWEQCGYVVTVQFADDFILNPDPLFLRPLEPLFKPEVQTYIELFLHQSPNWLDNDGALAIPFDALRARIGRWEKFRESSMAVPALVAHVDRQLHRMFQIYFCGMSNSLFYNGRNPIEPWAKSSYEQFLRLNATSRRYDLVKQAVAILKRHDWRLNPELIRLYEANGFSFDLNQ